MLETIRDSTRTLQYLLVDQLGSLDVIPDASGVIVQSMRFDALGKRRNPVDYSVVKGLMIFGFDTTRTTRGFTYHEQLDPVGYIHMNERVREDCDDRFGSPMPLSFLDLRGRVETHPLIEDLSLFGNDENVEHA